ncbi:type II toxin-antitoxin system Phd/YefM family antitoxin [bacterium]|nr:type II toxin-antitoxin system Phd/YefM family antitoxin [bacterium]
MKDLDSVQIIKENNKPKFAVLDYHLFEEVKEIVEDYLDHCHAESVIEKTSEKDWVGLDQVKKELNIK